MLINKSDFISKVDTMYLFRSCGWLHEKDMYNFTFGIKILPMLSADERLKIRLERERQRDLKRGQKSNTPHQTTLFDFI